MQKQKWRYRQINCVFRGGSIYVTSENGMSVKRKKMPGYKRRTESVGQFGGTKIEETGEREPYLWEFMNEQEQEGWELASVININNKIILILKQLD